MSVLLHRGAAVFTALARTQMALLRGQGPAERAREKALPAASTVRSTTSATKYGDAARTVTDRIVAPPVRVT